MRLLFWSEDALRDFDEALAHIARDNLGNATLVADRIDETVLHLSGAPIGHPGRVAGTYEKRVLRTPYILAYALSDQAVTILRVIHGRRHWPDDEWPTS